LANVFANGSVFCALCSAEVLGRFSGSRSPNWVTKNIAHHPSVYLAVCVCFVLFSFRLAGFYLLSVIYLCLLSLRHKATIAAIIIIIIIIGISTSPFWVLGCVVIQGWWYSHNSPETKLNQNRKSNRIYCHLHFAPQIMPQIPSSGFNFGVNFRSWVHSNLELFFAISMPSSWGFKGECCVDNQVIYHTEI